MKYAVLGSSGLIGTSLTAYLRKRQKKVLGFDIARSPREDLRKEPNLLLEALVQEVDFVVFLAFDVGGSVYLKNHQQSYEFISNNLRIMQTTFEVLRKFRKPFIFASSQMSNISRSSYGLLKAVGECFTRSLGGIVVKFWNVYGVERDLQKSHVVTDFILQAIRHRKICMLTDGSEERQFLYAEDACRALAILAQNYHSIPREEPLHVTSFQWVSIRSVAEMVAERFPGTEILPSQEKDAVQFSQRNEPDPAICKYWKPSVDLKDGVDRLIDYYSTSLSLENKVFI